MLHVFETYAIKNCGFCREWFCAQAHVKVGVSALHRGIGKTKQNANKEVVYSRENCCGPVDRREIDRKKMEEVFAHEDEFPLAIFVFLGDGINC